MLLAGLIYSVGKVAFRPSALAQGDGITSGVELHDITFGGSESHSGVSIHAALVRCDCYLEFAGTSLLSLWQTGLRTAKVGPFLRNISIEVC